MRERIYDEEMRRNFVDEAGKRGYPAEYNDNVKASMLCMMLMLMDHCNELEQRIEALEKGESND